MSTLRLPRLKVWACSGLTLSGAYLPRLKRRGLAPPNGSTKKGILHLQDALRGTALSFHEEGLPFFQDCISVFGLPGKVHWIEFNLREFGQVRSRGNAG